MQEKRVVEGMVENITSGVVSLDNEHRVLMRNRVAADLLELGVGDSLANALERSDRLVAVRDFLASAGKEPIQRTVELQDAEGNDLQWSLVWVPMPGSGEPSALSDLPNRFWAKASARFRWPRACPGRA